MNRSLIPHPFRGANWLESSFSNIQKEMNRLFDENLPGSLHRTGGVIPSMEVHETDTAFEVTAELPGVDEKDVQVSFEDGVLTIRGEKKAEHEEKKDGYRVSERNYGSFLRQTSMAGPVDDEKLAATFAKGVLKVTLPKLPEARSKAKKIAIKTST